MSYVARRVQARHKAHAIAIAAITAQCIGLVVYGMALAFIAYAFGQTL